MTDRDQLREATTRQALLYALAAEADEGDAAAELAPAYVAILRGVSRDLGSVVALTRASGTQARDVCPLLEGLSRRLDVAILLAQRRARRAPRRAAPAGT